MRSSRVRSKDYPGEAPSWANLTRPGGSGWVVRGKGQGQLVVGGKETWKGFRGEVAFELWLEKRMAA